MIQGPGFDQGRALRPGTSTTMNSLSSARGRVAAGVGEVVVAPDHQVVPRDEVDGLDRLAHHPERIAESKVARVDRWERHEVGVGNPGQVEHQCLLQEPSRVRVTHVDQVDPAERCREAPAPIPLDHGEAMTVQRPHV